ncbi:MAG: M6 family metalloprotease domain-containing protein [Lysobacterales bacterium]
MNKQIAVLVLILFYVNCANLWAGSAAPVVVVLSQQDGTTFKAVRRGDEYINWIETVDGHTVINVNGNWFYAVGDDAGTLRSSGIPVGSLSQPDLQSMPLHVKPARDQVSPVPRTIRKIPRTKSSRDQLLPAPQVLPLPQAISHQQKLLTILVDYSDIAFTYSDGSFQTRIYGAGNSVKDYFLDNSYGGFTIAAATESYGTSNDGVVHVTRATTHPNQGDDRNISREEARAIVSLTDTFVNYAAYDSNGDGSVSADELAIMIILAGYETSFAVPPTPNVWGHAWAFSSGLILDGVTLQPYTMFGERQSSHQATIGVMCHELGHLMLGLPDLYDTDDSSAGIGDWGLMGSGEWNQTGSWQGDSPAHLSSWSKVSTNFILPQDINSNSSGVSIVKADSNEAAKRIWIDKYKLREYFLVENRQKSGYDTGLPGSGLLIWHIDENVSANTDESHKLVDLEAADGKTQLDSNANNGDTGDPFPGLSNNRSFNNSSTPNSRDYLGSATQIGVTNISSSSATMTADMTPGSGVTGDHVSYYENGSIVSLGLNETAIWVGMRTQNNTAHSKFDGVDVYVNDPVGASIDISYYTSMTGGTPSGLIHSQTGFAAGPGWNRLLLTSPQTFPIGSERGVVLKITNDSGTYPSSYTPSSPGSGRSYVDQDGVGTFFPLCPSFCGDLNLAALVGDTQAALPPAPPSQVNASDGTFTDRVVITWTSVAAATAYNVYYSSSIGSSKTLLGQISGTSTNAMGLTPGTAYYFWVYSVNANGESSTGTYDTGFIKTVTPDPADLAITVLDASNGAYAPGASFIVKNKVDNIGGASSDAYRITFYASTDATITASDQSLGFQDYPALGPGENRSYNTPLQFPVSMPDGQYYIGAILSVNDANSANNTKNDPVPLTVDSLQPVFQISAGLNDAWYYPVTTGQGFFVTVYPTIGYISLSWFTYDTVRPDGNVTANLGEPGHRWLNAVGQYSGNQAVMNISFASGGIFDSSKPVTEITDGTITLTFTDCNNGTVEYNIPSINQQGTVPIQRVVSDNIALCESMSQQTQTSQNSPEQKTAGMHKLLSYNPAASVPPTQLLNMNAGMNDSWYYVVTTGQGFFINVFPVLGYVSLSWFTYDTVRPPENVAANLGEPGHRWLNALGQYSGNQAVMDISYASGGLFDSPTPVTEINDGTITLTFSDCANGTVEYNIPSINQQGTVPIRRVANDNIALCEILNQP